MNLKTVTYKYDLQSKPRYQTLQSLINKFDYSETSLRAWKSWNPDKHSFKTRIKGESPRSQIYPGREKGFSFIMASNDPALRCNQFDSTGFRVRFVRNYIFFAGVFYVLWFYSMLRLSVCLNISIALKVAILSPLDDINTNTPLISIPPDTEVNIDLYPEIKITDPETRSVPKVKFSRFI
jgi:hypothetical protein